MPHLINSGKGKLSDESIPLFILMEGGIFQNLKNKNMRVNFRAFSQSKPMNVSKTALELHVELVKKIDALLEETEREKGDKELHSTMDVQDNEITPPHVEVRAALEKKPIFPFSETAYVSPYHIYHSDIFEIEKPQMASVLPEMYAHSMQSERAGITTYVTQDELDAESLPIKNEPILNDPRESEPIFQEFFRVKLKEKELKNTLFFDKNSKQTVDKNTHPTATTNQKQKSTFTSLLKAKKNLQDSKQELEERKKQLDTEEKKVKQQTEELKRKEQEQDKPESDSSSHEKKECTSEHADEKKQDTDEKHQESSPQKRSLPEVKIRKREERQAIRDMKRKKKELLRSKKQGAVFAASLKKTSDTQKEEKKEKEENSSNKNLFEIERPMETTSETEQTKREKSDAPPTFTLEEEPPLDEDVRKVLKIADDLLEKLPENVIDEFATSDDFVLYEKVITKYKIK